MNEQQNPDPHGIITTAEEIARKLWQAEQNEEMSKDAPPPGSEAVEDEIKALEAVINAHLQSRMDADADVRGSVARFHIIELGHLVGADVPLWRVGGCDEGPCNNPECKVDHHDPHLYLVTKKSDGAYVILNHEEIFDTTEQNKACFGMAGMMAGTIKIDLGDIVGKAIEEKVRELAEKTTSPDEDDLPPAASVAVTESDDERRARIKEQTQRLIDAYELLSRPGACSDDPTAPLPVVDIDEYCVMRPGNENSVRPGWLRRVWRWFWDWLRR